MIIPFLVVFSVAFARCLAANADAAVDAMKACSKDLGIKEDVVNKLESAIRGKIPNTDQDPARLQDDIKTQVTQMMNASGVGNQINDLSDCILNRLKDK